MASLEERIHRLERQNKLLLLGIGVAALSVVLGFKQAQQPQQPPAPIDLIRAKRIDIVDDRGVPVLTLDVSRTGGGQMTLRDESGDKRAWLTSGHDTVRLGMVSGTEDAPTASVGLGVEPAHARVALTGGRASAATAIDEQHPELTLNGSDGKVLFSAPWRTHD